jgi:hypothetical protein
MDITAQQETWNTFKKLMTVTAVSVAVLLVLMALFLL